MAVIKTCPTCSKGFVKRTAGGRPHIYCGRVCMQRAQNIKRAERKRIGQKDCVICGKTYRLTKYSGPQKACSVECRKRRKAELRKLRPKEEPRHSKTCVGCGKAFLVTSAGKRLRYCSRACYFDHRPACTYAGKYTRPVFDARNCTMCGKAYIPSIAHQRLCGDPCKTINAKQAARAWRALHGKEAQAKYRSPEWRAGAEERKRQRLARQQAEEAVMVADGMQTCLWCGDDFEGLPGDIYCSDECNWDDAAERRREGAL